MLYVLVIALLECTIVIVFHYYLTGNRSGVMKNISILTLQGIKKKLEEHGLSMMNIRYIVSMECIRAFGLSIVGGTVFFVHKILGIDWLLLEGISVLCLISIGLAAARYLKHTRPEAYGSAEGINSLLLIINFFLILSFWENDFSEKLITETFQDLPIFIRMAIGFLIVWFQLSVFALARIFIWKQRTGVFDKYITK